MKTNARSSDLSIDVFPANKPGVVLNYNGFDISGDDAQLINITELWISNGSVGARPYDWSRTVKGKKFLESVEAKLNTSRDRIWQSRRGRHGGGVWAHWQVALEYAGHLSVELRQLLNSAVREFVKEEKDPELKISRAIESYRRKGKSESWIADRIAGIAARNEFCGRLKSRGVMGEWFRRISSEINSKIIGMSSEEFRKRNGIAKSASVRDSMNSLQLAAIRLSEVLSSEVMERNNSRGGQECLLSCQRALAHVKNCIEGPFR